MFSIVLSLIFKVTLCTRSFFIDKKPQDKKRKGKNNTTTTTTATRYTLLIARGKSSAAAPGCHYHSTNFVSVYHAYQY